MKRGSLFILPVILNFLFSHGSSSQTPSENLYAVTTFESYLDFNEERAPWETH
jgi:hypothetical protein